MRQRTQDRLLAFLRAIDKAVPPESAIHVVVDNHSTHKRLWVKSWLAARSRWHLHFIPTYSSRLNPVKRFFALITDETIRRSSFQSARELITKIDSQ